MMNQSIIERLIPITEEEQRILDGQQSIDRDIYMTAEADIIKGKKLLSAGKLITIRPHTRFVHFPEHTHDFVEVIYMCLGSTTHIVNGDEIKLKEGELLFLSQNTRQEIMPAGEKDIAVNFIILPAFFDSILQMLGDEETPLRRFIVDCIRNNNNTGGYLHFEVSDILPIQNLVENLVWTLIYGAPNKRKINQFTMGLLFLQLLNHTDRLVYQNKEDEDLMQIFQYIEEHYADGSLTDLAKILHYDFSWLSREIREKTGKTYTEFVQEKRMSQSGFLLRNTSISVAEIAQRVGYSNMSYFHRLFHKSFGMSPKKYRASGSIE